MPPKPAPRLLTPADPPRDRSRFTTTHLTLLVVPIVLWLLYSWLRPAPTIVVPPPPAATAPTAETAPAPAVRQKAAPPAPPAADHAVAQQDPLANYPRANSTWGDVLNPQKLIPAEGYTAYYLDTGQSRSRHDDDDGRPRSMSQTLDYVMPAYTPEPHHLRHTEQTEHIRVPDVDTQIPYGIPAYRFAAYWVGRLHVPQRARYHLNLTQRSGISRVLLDKHILMTGKPMGSRLTFELEAGDHLVEIEYTNDWSSANFQLYLDIEIPEVRVADLPATLAALALPTNTVVYLVDVHGSDAPNDSIRLYAPLDGTPYILLLNSRRAVQWTLNGRPPAVVVYNLANRGSRIHADRQVPLLTWGEGIETAPPDETQNPPQKPECECRQDGFYCRERNLTLYDYATAIRQLTGYPLAGFNHDDSVRELAIPAIPVTAQDLAPGEKIVREINEQRIYCYRTLSR